MLNSEGSEKFGRKRVEARLGRCFRGPGRGMLVVGDGMSFAVSSNRTARRSRVHGRGRLTNERVRGCSAPWSARRRTTKSKQDLPVNFAHEG